MLTSIGSGVEPTTIRLRAVRLHHYAIEATLGLDLFFIDTGQSGTVDQKVNRAIESTKITIVYCGSENGQMTFHLLDLGCLDLFHLNPWKVSEQIDVLIPKRHQAEPYHRRF